jgi:biopolymer transport protein ExbD
VPVPLGAPDAPAGEPDDERVNLSVYIGKDHVWVGLSRVNEFQELARGTDLADTLTRALQEQKASAFFADRTDLEIGADDGVSYADVVSVIDVATKAGFTDWRLARLQALSARPTL